ncbi:hypothetical protein GCM10007874_29250 [Labrys miyagiensis]|uniref:Uncharacterized protein n=1 Tax=Labrys miyagiensis TaxID=346912 RepID=A0ABQ6CHU1_9HYPH|nr:hypothetical protein GCM10007874_29250 [Labrys miyagiensis]
MGVAVAACGALTVAIKPNVASAIAIMKFLTGVSFLLRDEDESSNGAIDTTSPAANLLAAHA